MAEPSAKSITIGFFLIVGGMFFRGWSSGYLNKDNELATGGPYSLTRNPLYFANFILGLGIAVAGNNIYTYAIFFLYYLFFFPFLMVIEHRRLKKKFGRRYDDWAKKSNVFLPKIKRIKEFNFNISFYMKNREYRVLFYSLFVIAVLILKYLRLIKVT
jgi:protein-S-isoprenylcysteine O-methyltransferase Ste14